MTIKSTTFVCFTVSVLLAGCATAPPRPPEPDRLITVTCEMPSTTPLQETKEIQIKGGIQIIVAVEPFQCVQAIRQEAANRSAAHDARSDAR